MAKLRIDQLLVERGLAESRARAQALIKAGLVYAGAGEGGKVDKPSAQLDDTTPITLKGRDHPWVSRGGLKLDHALSHFGWDVDGAVAMDVGSSTGGFTDVLLTRGVAKVYAVDSGTDQLVDKLRNDSRVIVYEQLSARLLTTQHVTEMLDLIVCDASFISLAKVLDVPLTFAKDDARLIALIKPQFEADRNEIGKKGVVKDPAVQERVCHQIKSWLIDKGWTVIGVTPSPITGPEGNVEFLIAATRNAR